MEPGQVVLPKVEFIEDVEKFLEGKTTDTVLQSLQDLRRKYSMLESQLTQRKARLIGKLPEIQKTLDIVNLLIEKQGAEMTFDFELAEAVYAKSKVSNVKTVNLWLGADVMLEYTLDEAKELLETNLSNCKSNLSTLESDLDVIKDSITTIEVSISRVWNHDVEKRRLAKEQGSSKVEKLAEVD